MRAQLPYSPFHIDECNLHSWYAKFPPRVEIYEPNPRFRYPRPG